MASAPNQPRGTDPFEILCKVCGYWFFGWSSSDRGLRKHGWPRRPLLRIRFGQTDSARSVACCPFLRLVLSGPASLDGMGA
jgi:hypothetical protein